MEATCQACGKTFSTSPSRIRDGKGKYCSNKCSRSIYRAPHNRKEPARRICRYCGKEFIVRSSHATEDRGQYCSVACNLAVQHAAAKTPLEQRYWSKVIKTDDCWQWTGAKNRRGYGVLNLGRGKGNVLAHRASWAIHFGPIPEGMNALHKCDNPECTRPDHLFLGTYADNMQDALQKGRIEGWRAKLTWEQAQEIRARYSQGEQNRAHLAQEYGVSETTIHNVIHFKSFKIMPARLRHDPSKTS